MSDRRRRAGRGRHRAASRRRSGAWRCCSCTGPATTTGASPRARRTRRVRRGDRASVRSRRRPGLRCTPRRTTLGETRYRDSKGRDKVVRYWLMEPDRGGRRRCVRAERRGRRAALVLGRRGHRPPQLRARPRAPRQGARAHMSKHVTIYLVRHAKAGSRRAWSGDDDAAAAVEARAARRPRRWRSCSPGEHVTRIVSSPFVRCVETVEPLARAHRGRGRAVGRPRRGRAAGRRRCGCSRSAPTSTRCSARTATCSATCSCTTRTWASTSTTTASRRRRSGCSTSSTARCAAPGTCHPLLLTHPVPHHPRFTPRSPARRRADGRPTRTRR